MRSCTEHFDVGTYDGAKLASLAEACLTARGNFAKGEAMADLVEYVFGEIPGLALIERSHLSPDKSAEVDLIFRNDPFVSRLPTYGVTLFFECKNEARKISAAQVRVFGSKLGERNQRLGVMVSRLGLSGGQWSHGHAVISKELAAGRTIVVLTLNDFRQLASSDELLGTFQSRMMELEINATYISI